ncbi:MAG: M50 family metallopeptidase, partial [Microbacteriaceae bacterium]
MTETLLYLTGILIIIIGLAISIGLHEFGHLIPAKLFGVRVPNWAIGFGPRLFSKKIGETEYSIRAIPLGGFITLIGMYPPAKPGKDDSKRWFSGAIKAAREAHQEHVQPGDESRMFYQLAAWKRIVVMFGGPFMNLVLGISLISVALSGIGQFQRVNTIASVIDCEAQMIDPASSCVGSPDTPAKLAALQKGDRILAVNGVSLKQTEDPFAAIIAEPKRLHQLTIERAGHSLLLELQARVAALPYADAAGNMAIDATGKPLLKDRAYLGVMLDVQRVPVTFGASLNAGMDMTGQTLAFIGKFPQQVYQSVASLFDGRDRAVDSAISIVGITQIAGSTNANQDATLADRLFLNLTLLGSLNLALFAFNMIPLPPLDGGHIAGGIYEYLKRGLFRILRKPDPGNADTALLAPLANAMFLILLLAGVLMI